jgi:hypothetical protein
MKPAFYHYATQPFLPKSKPQPEFRKNCKFTLNGKHTNVLSMIEIVKISAQVSRFFSAKGAKTFEIH